MQGEGKHLYGVIREEEERDFGFTGIGERQDKVYTIHHQGLAAVVSDSPPIDYRLIPQEAVVRHLANDQMARLRVLLANHLRITFGRHTGETEAREGNAVGKYRKIFGREPHANEIVSRERMRETPPHILLTNCAMLEYLLLRPADNVFFDGEYSRDWRFLILDDDHTYTGSKGIEMAMLLRRLRDRVVGGKAEQLRCVIASATLGRGEDDFPDVAQFARRLLGEQARGCQRLTRARSSHGWGFLQRTYVYSSASR